MITGLNILLLGFLGLATSRRLQRDLGDIVYWGLIAKLLGAFALGFVYHYVWEGGDTSALHHAVVEHNANYSGSIGRFFRGLLSPIDWMAGNPRSVFFTRVLSPVGWLTGHNYWLMSGYLAVFSFWCTWLLIRTLIKQYPDAKWACIIGLGFLPSYIFWSSGFLKDTLANACAAYIAAVVLSSLWSRTIRWKRLPLALLLFLILVFTRHYLAGMVLLVLSLAVAGDLLSGQRWAIRLLALSVIFILGTMCFRYVYVRLRVDRLPLTVYELHEEVKAKSKRQDIVDFGLKPTWFSLMRYSPSALMTGLFRPWPWEAETFLSMMQALENALMLLLSLLTFWQVRKIRWDPVIVAACIFVLMLATLLTLVTPNFGSLSRYKAGFSPYFFVLVAVIPLYQLFEKPKQIN